jgi:hypothetical protein
LRRSRVVGRFVIHCALLEWAAFEAIHHLEPDANKAEVEADKEVAARVDALLRLSEQHWLPADWILLWKRVRSLIEDRKDIVHNPIWVAVWSNKTGELCFGEPEIRRFRKRIPQNRKLTPEFIRKSVIAVTH